jgi:hypothetical protein
MPLVLGHDSYIDQPSTQHMLQFNCVTGLLPLVRRDFLHQSCNCLYQQRYVGIEFLKPRSVQVVCAIRMAMFHIRQLKRRTGEASTVELYWLDTVRDVPAMCKALLRYLPKLQASSGMLFEVLF